MSHSLRSIGEPYTIAHIPKPLDSAHGQTYASDVYSLVGSKKRKRSEIAFASDGESIGVYEVESPRLSTSYALSPQSKCTCAPCCIRYKPPKAPAQRFTYCSLVDSSPKIQLYHEKVGKDGATVGSSDNPIPRVLSYTIPESSSPIGYIDILPSTQAEQESDYSFDVVSIHQDGEMRCLRPDLSKERWRVSVISLIPSWKLSQISLANAKIEYANVLDAETAGKGLLKNRPDLQAMLAAGTSAISTFTKAAVLFLVTISQNSTPSVEWHRCYHVFSIGGNHKLTDTGGLEGIASPVQYMESSVLPEPGHSAFDSESLPAFILHPPSGRLYHSVKGDLRVYDLSGTVPKLSDTMRIGDHNATSFLRLSSSTVLASSSEFVSMHDTKYRSVQARLPISTVPGFKGTWHGKAVQSSPFQLISYYSNLGLVLALSDNHDLFAMQVTMPSLMPDTYRKRKRDGLLIDSIKKGTRDTAERHESSEDPPAPLGQYLLSRTCEDKRWKAKARKLDVMVAKRKVNLFDDSMCRALGLTTYGKPSIFVPEIKHKILYALGKIFSWTVARGRSRAPNDPNVCKVLRVVFFPPKLFGWLVASGNLSASQVELAIRGAGLATSYESLPPGALTEALIDCDPSLRTLVSVLEGPVYLDATELGLISKRLLHMMEAAQSNSTITVPNEGSEHVKADAKSLAMNTALVVRDKNPTFSNKQAHLQRRTLLAALRKLHFFPSSTITEVFRKQFLGRETVDLINQLRVELVRRGWTRNQADEKLLAQKSAYSDSEWLIMIITLLSSALDSIGIGGWVFDELALDEPQEKEDTITYMRAEMSDVLYCIQEATYLDGMLTQMLVFGKSVTTPTAASSQELSTKSTGFSNFTRRGPLVLPRPNPDAELEKCLLPLGLKAPRQAVSLTKVGAGGEIQPRSKRDIQRLKSMQVGKYTREKIRYLFVILLLFVLGIAGR